jgi:hypothetical protein
LRSAQRHDGAVVGDILDLTASVLADAAPLSLRDGPHFSADVAAVLQPALNFLKAIATTGKQTEHRQRAVRKSNVYVTFPFDKLFLNC